MSINPNINGPQDYSNLSHNVPNLDPKNPPIDPNNKLSNAGAQDSDKSQVKQLNPLPEGVVQNPHIENASGKGLDAREAVLIKALEQSPRNAESEPGAAPENPKEVLKRKMQEIRIRSRGKKMAIAICFRR